jgi:aspartyl-tRNA(Asn)/glutamyl-tRNA(Gln) amidotransferase subunit B
MSDDSELEKIIQKVIEDNPKPAEEYKSGKQNVLQFLAGKVMAASRGTANPEKVLQLLKDLLK